MHVAGESQAEEAEEGGAEGEVERIKREIKEVERKQRELEEVELERLTWERKKIEEKRVEQQCTVAL